MTDDTNQVTQELEKSPDNLPQAAELPSETQHPLARWMMEAATWADALEVAKQIATTDLVPAGLKKNPANIVTAVMKGHEVGLPAMASLSFIAPINGRPFIYGEGYLALIQAKGGYFDTRELFDDAGQTIGFVVKAFREGRPSQEGRFSLEDASKAGLINAKGQGRGSDGGAASPWGRYTRDMLWWRAVHRAGTRQFSDWLAGLAPTQVSEDYIDGELAPISRSPEDVTEEPRTRGEAVLETLTADSAEEEVVEETATESAGDAAKQPQDGPELVAAVNGILERYKAAETPSDVETLDVELGNVLELEYLADGMRQNLIRAANAARLRLKMPPRTPQAMAPEC